MNKKNTTILLFVLLFANIVNAGTNEDSVKYAYFSFNLGLNSNWITNDSQYEGGFTGIGFLFEPRIGKAFSIAVTYNYAKVEKKYTHLYEDNFKELNTTYFVFLLRWRFYFGQFALFPEVGIGRWGDDVSSGMYGLGIEYKLFRQIYGSLNFDSVGYCKKCLDVGGGGSSGGHLRIVFGLSYLIELKKAVQKRK
jgi:hypothetical protein